MSMAFQRMIATGACNEFNFIWLSDVGMAAGFTEQLVLGHRSTASMVSMRSMASMASMRRMEMPISIQRSRHPSMGCPVGWCMPMGRVRWLEQQLVQRRRPMYDGCEPPLANCVQPRTAMVRRRPLTVSCMPMEPEYQAWLRPQRSNRTQR